MNKREIIFDNIVNARHLGGLKTKDGQTVRDNLILRTGNLSKASDEDLRKLKSEYDLKCIFDLRTDTERAFAPDLKVEGAEYIWINVLGKDSPGTDPKEARDISVIDEQLIRSTMDIVKSGFLDGKLQQTYYSLATSEISQKEYARLFDELIAQNGGTVLWHCSQGKDRAGFATVLLLSALGVDREAILDDYELSNDGYRKQLEIAETVSEEVGLNEQQKGTLRAMVGVNRDYMSDILQMIDEKYKSMDDYLCDMLNLTAEKIEMLKKWYLQ